MTTPSPETPRIPEGKEQEARKVAERIRNALSALRSSIGNPEQKEEEQDQAAQELIGALAEAGKLEEIVNGSAFNDPELLELIEHIGQESTAPDTTAIVEMLKEQKDARADIDQLADEIGAVDTYLAGTAETVPEKKSFYTQISERIEQFAAEKLPDGAIREIAERFKMNLTPEQIANVRDFIIGMIKSFVAGMVEKLPGMEDTAGNLRWDTALARAKSPDGGLNVQQRKQLENPTELAQVKSEWMRSYKAWLRRKKELSARGEAFTEEAPTVAGIFAQREQVAVQEAAQGTKKLFELEGLEQNKEFEVTKETPLKIEGKQVTISKEKITIDGKSKKITGTVEAIKLLAPTDVAADLRIKFQVAGLTVEKKLDEHIVKKFGNANIQLSDSPALALESIA
ncbi:MAG: hypothetical protein PHU04_00490 [Candidatus Peribacteraceae bacterium]|nr:hypothetical protein [Candidatus Peribacteraceae bacterium]